MIGVFLVAAAVSIGLDDLAGVSADVSGFVDPLRSLHKMSLILFGEKNRAMELTAPPPLWMFVLQRDKNVAMTSSLQLWVYDASDVNRMYLPRDAPLYAGLAKSGSPRAGEYPCSSSAMANKRAPCET